MIHLDLRIKQTQTFWYSISQLLFFPELRYSIQKNLYNVPLDRLTKFTMPTYVLDTWWFIKYEYCCSHTLPLTPDSIIDNSRLILLIKNNTQTLKRWICKDWATIKYSCKYITLKFLNVFSLVSMFLLSIFLSERVLTT